MKIVRQVLKPRIKKGNLLKIAEHIKTIPQDKFDMGNFRQFDFTNIETEFVGDVISLSVILDKDNVINNFTDEYGIAFREWSRYYTGLEPFSDRWDWCFSWKWKNIDNTPTGASKRIKYLLENGLDGNWEEQINGFEPISY